MRTATTPDWLLAVLVHDDEKPPLEPFGVVEVEGTSGVPLVVDELVFVARSFEPIGIHRFEALAELDC